MQARPETRRSWGGALRPVSRSFLAIVTGQSVWAVSQAGIVLFLSSQGRFELLGVLVLGLAIFAPVCLIGSLNLRTVLVVRRGEPLDMGVFFRIRAAAALAALLLTGILLLAVAQDWSQWAVALALVATRVGDQLSDVAIAGYQNAGQRGRIARSLALRGVAVLVPFVGLVLAGGDLLAAALTAMVAAIATSLLADVRPVLAQKGARLAPGELRGLLREYIWVSPYPIIDSLHFSSFRYAIYLLGSAEALGLVGVAQTLFVPVQLLGSALAYGHLPTASRLVAQGDQRGYRRHLARGLLRGAALNLAFLAAVLIAPLWLLDLVFGERGAEAWPFLVLVGVAMLPRTVSGLSGLSVVARGRQFAYSAAPALALLSFWLFSGAAVALGINAPVAVVAISFLASGVLRLSYLLFQAADPLEPGETRTEAGR